MVISLATVATRFRGYLLYASILGVVARETGRIRHLTATDQGSGRCSESGLHHGGENPSGILAGVISSSHSLLPPSSASFAGGRILPIVVSQEVAPAAINAVKLWKYKPYMLQRSPVGIETLVAFNFELHRKLRQRPTTFSSWGCWRSWRSDCPVPTRPELPSRSPSSAHRCQTR